MMNAQLIEIFGSIQGEGTYLGERHLFVRFAGCHRSCAYCDTPFVQVPELSIETAFGSGKMHQESNPVSPDQLTKLLTTLDPEQLAHRLSITGGEPLLQADFLEEWLPEISKLYPIYLETAGDLVAPLQRVLPWIQTVAMDWKLESVSGEKSRPELHEEFLAICQKAGVEVLVKLVVSAKTNEQELLAALNCIKKVGGTNTPVIFQPLTPSSKMKEAPSGTQLLSWQESALRILSSVRVIPQVHQSLNLF